MSFARFLAAGAILSLVLHGTGAAFFAKDPDEVSIAASEGSGVAVIGSIEDLVAGAQVDAVADHQPVEDVTPDVAPIEEAQESTATPEVQPDTTAKPVEMQPAPAVAEAMPDMPVSEAVPSVPAMAGVTSTEPVTAPVTTESRVTLEPVKPVKPAPQQKPVDLARVEPVAPVKAVKPMEPQTEMQQPVADPLAEVTQTPTRKPKPPVRKAEAPKVEQRDTPKKVVKTRTRGAETNARKGGERITSKSAKSNVNGRANARTNDGGTKATSNYQGKVVAKLRRAKRYPREAKRQRLVGTVNVGFTISSNGAVSGIRITRSSGHPVLDQAALDMVRRASPMPKFPGDIRVARMNMQVPVRFDR
ncbi:TonB family protein [Roseibium sp. FZY0029]|uniref:energy transducer TonB n=1 Tax=Roseibium sp. FZY0029 TaxID=3116647 RepID=UPI002EC662B1|nr:TonB family protein [Roseibium sp. FZY0029]